MQWRSSRSIVAVAGLFRGAYAAVARADVLEPFLIACLLASHVFTLLYLWLFSPNFRDFQIFYESGRAWLAGRDPYLPALSNMNPPAFVVAFTPLSALPIRVALIVWWLLNAAAAVAAVRVLVRETGLRLTRRHVLIAAAFVGTDSQLILSQLVWLLMLPAVLGWRGYRRGRDVSAGIWWGVVFAVKPIFLPLLLGMMWRRRYRGVGTAIVTGAVISLAGWIATGTAAYGSWIATGAQVFWFQLPLNASVLGLLWRAGLPKALTAGIWLASIAAIVVMTRWRGRPAHPDRDLAVWLVACLLVAPLGWIYYLPLAAGPLIAWHRAHPWPPRAWLLVAGLFWPSGLWSYPITRNPTTFETIIACAYGASLIALWALVQFREGGPMALPSWAVSRDVLAMSPSADSR